MSVNEAQLKQIIQEELENTLDEFNYSAAAGAGIRAAQLSSGTAMASGEEAELTLGGLTSELRALLEEWEQKSYPSDEARYEGYYEDIQQVTERYDPCAHPGESCGDAHPDQEHEECIRDNEESDEE